MAYLTDLSLDDAARVAAAHGLPMPEQVEALPGGTVNSNFRLRSGGLDWFLRIYEEQDQEGVFREERLLAALAEAGIPVAPMRPRTRGEVVRVAGKPTALFPFRPGRMSCQAGVTPGRCREVGRTLARVHAAGRGLPGALLPPSRFDGPALEARLDRLAATGRPDLSPTVDRARETLNELADWDRGLPRGLVHGDLFRDNVLFAETPEGGGDEQVAAFLDWESASEGPWLLDLAVFVLSWCWGDGLDLELAEAAIEGYREGREGGVHPTEPPAFRDALRFGATRFLVTRLTDVELRRDRVAPGKDYRRFLQRLDEVDARSAADWGATLRGTGT